jgi:hypothetical protein
MVGFLRQPKIFFPEKLNGFYPFFGRHGEIVGIIKLTGLVKGFGFMDPDVIPH